MRVELTETAAADAVLGALPTTFPIFQWHDDTFSLPERAERLASNAVAENQAFRIGRATYGIQFHFEADRPLVREWNVAFSAYIAERHPDWPGRFESEAERHGPDADAAGLAIARAWVKIEHDPVEPAVMPSRAWHICHVRLSRFPQPRSALAIACLRQ